MAAKKPKKIREQFNFSLNTTKESDKKTFAVLETLMEKTGLDRSNLIHTIVVMSLPGFAKKHGV